MLRSKSSGGQRAERKNRGGLKWTSRGRRQETKKEKDRTEGKRGGGGGGGQSNLLPCANDVLPSPGREREPLPLIDVKCVIFFFFTVNQGWFGWKVRGECGVGWGRKEVLPVWWGWPARCRCCRLDPPGLSCPCPSRWPSLTAEKPQRITSQEVFEERRDGKTEGRKER